MNSLCRHYGQMVSIHDVWRRGGTADDTAEVDDA